MVEVWYTLHILHIVSKKDLAFQLYFHRSDPDYYEKVTQPIDLSRIQQKIKAEEYEDIEDLTMDLQLLVNNAKLYYDVSRK